MSRILPHAGAFLLTTALACAQTDPPRVPVSPGSAGSGKGIVDEPRAKGAPRRTPEFHAHQAAKVSLAEAIGAAERQVGGRAIGAEFEGAGSPRYEVTVLGAGGKTVAYVLDAGSGQVIGTRTGTLESFTVRLKASDVEGAPTSLRQAVTLAEARVGGKPIEAEIARDSDTVRYQITVVKAGKGEEVTIDANGKIIPSN